MAADNPFVPGAEAAYRRWRERKLDLYPMGPRDLLVPVADFAACSESERAALRARLDKANMAIYVAPPEPEAGKDAVRAFGRLFGLERLDANMLSDEDGISPIAVAGEGARTRYIPYTDRPISWHTDGYYNDAAHQVRAMVLHCARPAAEGGETHLLDHELAYILLRDANPRHVAALSAPDVMTIPANTEEGVERPAQTGPVFSVDAGGNLHMRYTARKRSIVWKDDPEVLAAVRLLEEICASDSPYVFRHRLEAGQGLICNNVLHNRTAFRDDGPRGRLLYRARYHDRIATAGQQG